MPMSRASGAAPMALLLRILLSGLGVWGVSVVLGGSVEADMEPVDAEARGGEPDGAPLLTFSRHPPLHRLPDLRPEEPHLLRGRVADEVCQVSVREVLGCCFLLGRHEDGVAPRFGKTLTGDVRCSSKTPESGRLICAH